MTARKVLTRAEAQARTREELLAAAEKLFATDGYHATSIAAIAAASGRTIGAVYSNFENKEDLCVEVLKRRFSGEFADLLVGLAGSPDDLDARLDVLSSWWIRKSAEFDLVALVAEFVLSVVRDPARQAEAAETVEQYIQSARVLLDDYLPEGMTGANAETNDAAHAIASTIAGLAFAQAAGLLGAEQSVGLLTQTFRLWIGKLSGAA